MYSPGLLCDGETGTMVQLKLVKTKKTEEDCRIGQVPKGEGDSIECINKGTTVVLVFIEP